MSETEIIRVEGQDLICEEIEVEYFDAFGQRPTNISPGDTVIGRRNGDWKIGTVSERLWPLTLENGYMYCNEVTFYPFNFGECRKVVDFA